MTAFHRISTLILVCLAVPLTASAVTHEVSIYLDLDDDTVTGCDVTTVDGTFQGAEQVLVSTVETTAAPDAGMVTDVAIADCVDEVTDTFGPATSFDGNWPVGVGNGLGGRDVVETYVPLVQLVITDPAVVHLGVVVTDELGNEESLFTVDGTPEGDPIVLSLQSILEIPTLSQWGLLLLALLLAAASIALLGRRRAAALGLALVLLAAGTAWAAGTLDGLTGDWSAGDQLAANGLVLFAKADTDQLCFRVDVDLLFNQPPTITDVADQTIPEDGTTGPLAFTVGDAESAATALTVTATSSNQVLVPDGNLTLGGAGANRTIEVTPAANQNGMTDVTVTVEDPDGATASTTFRVTVTSENDPPTISAIADQSIDEDTSTGPLAFTVGDVETPPGSLTVTAASDDQMIIPDGNLVLGGSGANRTITVTPAADQNGGPVTITVTVMDTDGGSVPEQFDVTVNPVNDPPTISAIANQTIDEDTSTGALAFTIDDVDDPVGSLTVSAASSDQTLIPDGNLVIGGAAPNLTIEATPAADENGGPATITVTVTDPSAAPASETFDVTVNPVNDPPAVASSTIGYNAVGNTLLRVPGNDPDHDGGVPGRIASTSDAADAFAKAGPSDIDSASVGFQAGTFATSNTGSLTIDDDGDFHYTPPTGFTGTDDVVVNVEDTEGLTTPVTIEITVAELVWYVEDTTDATKNPAGGPGTSRDAFETLAAAESASGIDDFIVVFETTGALDEGITLKSGQKLYGQPVEDEATPLLPGGLLLEEIADTGARPVIDHTSGDAVTVAATGASLADVEIRHLDLSGSDNAVDVTADAGFDAGVLIQDCVIGGAGGGAGIAAATTATAGTMTLQILENSGITATGSGVSVDGSAGGTVIVTAFADNSVSGDTTGHGYFFDTVTFDADTGTANLQQVDGNAVAAGSGGDGVGASGMVLVDVTGDLSIDDLDLVADGSGLVATGTGELTGAAGFRITTGAGSTIVANGGPAVDVDPATVALTFDSISSASSPGAGVSLVDVGGTFSAAAGSVTGSAGNAFHLTATSASPLDVTYGGTVTNGAGRLINVDGLPAGSDLLFNGLSLSDSGGTGIAVNDFGGVMTVTAGSSTITNSTSTGFAATGDTDGTVNLDDVTITNPAGTAVHVVDGADQIGGSFDFDNVDVSQGTDGARLLDVQGLSAGAVDFDAASALSATDGTGVNVSSNAGTSSVTLNGPVDLGTSVSRLTDGTAFNMSGNSAGTTVTAPDVDVFTSGQTAVNATGSGLLDLDALSISTVSDGRALDLDGIESLVDVDTVTCSHNSNCVDLTGLAASSTTTFADADLTCTGGTCFNASAARTVEVAGGGNTISATNAVGLNMTNTTIGASGVTFQSVSANGASAGIVLDTTGNTGDFEVTGDGASSTSVTTAGRTTSAEGGGSLNLGSGGTISNTTDGVRLTSATDVFLRNLVIGESTATPSDPVSGTTVITDNGIEATSLTNLVLDNVLISQTGDHGIEGFGSNVGLTLIHTEILNAGDNGAGATDGDDAMDFNTGSGAPLTGVVTVQSSILAGMSDTGLEVENFSGDLDLTVTDSFIGNNHHSDGNCNPCEGDGFLLRADGGSATIDMVVQNTTFNDIANDGIDLGNDQASNVSTLIAENLAGTNNDNADNLIDTANTNGTLRARITDLSSDSLHRGTVLFFKADGAATTDVTIDTSGASPNLIQGSAIGAGIQVFVDGDPGTGVLANGNARVLIENTDISSHFSEGVSLIVQDMANASGTLDATLDSVTTQKPFRGDDAIVGSLDFVAGGGGDGTLQFELVNSSIGEGSDFFGSATEGLVLRGDRQIDVACVDDGNGGNGTPCTNIGSTTSDDSLVADVMNENGNQVAGGSFAGADVFTSTALRSSSGEVLIISPAAVTDPTLP